MRHRQIAGSQQHEQAFARLLPGMKFLELAHIIDTRIGAGIGGHHQAFIKQHSHAIGHRLSQPILRHVAAKLHDFAENNMLQVINLARILFAWIESPRRKAR